MYTNFLCLSNTIASGERSTEDVAPVPPPKDAPKDVHKDTVIDQLKRRATEVNHFFNKKRAEASAPTTETATATAGNFFFFIFIFFMLLKRG